MLETAKITMLKNKARKHYTSYMTELDRYSCGHALADHISSSKSEHARKFNETMEQLEKVDPSCPKDWDRL